MTTARIGITIAMCSAVATAAPARAQDIYREHPTQGLIRGGGRSPRAAVTGNCPSFVLHGEAQFANAVADSTLFEQRCRVDTSYALPTADRVRWLAVRYERINVFPADSFARVHRNVTRDTATLITAALYSAPLGVDRWRAEWKGLADASIVRSVTPTIGSRPDGSALVNVEYCINGTGGCWQEFMRRHGGRWTPVVQAFWKELRAATSDQIGKGAGIDVRTLNGSQGVYSPADPNCCPSHEVVFELIQRGDSLLLRSAVVKASTP